MRKLSLSFVTVVALVAAVSASSLFARAQGAARFDYLRLSPGLPGGMEIPPTARVGYQACLATYVEWKCREFESKDSSDGGLRAALTTLGNECTVSDTRVPSRFVNGMRVARSAMSEEKNSTVMVIGISSTNGSGTSPCARRSTARSALRRISS